MGKNITQKKFYCAGTFTVPAGVKLLTVSACYDQAVVGGTGQVMETAGAILANGLAVGWGANTTGQIGDATTAPKSSPVAVFGGQVYSKKPAVGGQGGLALPYGGTLVAWGSNPYGQVGDNTIANKSTPTLVVGSRSFASFISNGETVAALTESGAPYLWGRSNYGQIGDNAASNRSSPTAVVGGHQFKSIAVSAAAFYGMKADGTVLSWGVGINGLLGSGATASRSSPASVIGGHTFASFPAFQLTGPSGGVSMFAMKTDGTIWGWGSNAYGQLGDGTNTDRSSPVQVIGGLTFESLVYGLDNAVLAKTTDGKLYAWGRNDYGQIGDGTTNNRSSPVQIAAGMRFQTVIAGPEMNNYAIKSDGSVYAWGFGMLGRLGTGGAANISSPMAVAGGHKFVGVYPCYTGTVFALKADGSLWSWGANNSGFLGDGSTTNRASPVAVIGGYTFAAPSRVLERNFMAVTPGQSVAYGIGAGFFGTIPLPVGTTSVLLEYES